MNRIRTRAAAWWVGLFVASMTVLGAGEVRLRIVAANLTSGRDQSYSPDNGNHSNPEGAGARILKGLKPDVVLVQEFNCTIGLSQWVNETLGRGYSHFREAGAGIPNGIISRFPIVESGEWDDLTQSNRDFVWARLRLPNGRDLWAISVHLKAGSEPGLRRQQARALVEFIRRRIPEEDMMVMGGDLNTADRREACLTELGRVFKTEVEPPIDQRGQEGTNSSRRRPYDWVLADADLQACGVPVELGGDRFPSGLVFDTRVFQPLQAAAPAQPGDSAAPQMQHMAVVRDFVVPARP